jgi:hypothetical protein
MKQLEIFLEEIRIIDWYDGIVQAIAKGSLKSYLVILIKWDMKHSEKKFLVLELSTNNVLELESCFIDKSESSKKGNWDKYASVFNRIVRNHEGEMYLLSKEPEIKINLAVEVTENVEYLQNLQNHSVEKAIT